MRCRIINDLSRLNTLIDLFTCPKCNFMNENAIMKAYFEDKDYFYDCKCIFNYCPHCGQKINWSDVKIIKFYCNKCGIELKVENRRKVKMLISFYREINLDFCENCFKEVIGDIEYCELIKKETEHKKRLEERKVERSKNI